VWLRSILLSRWGDGLDSTLNQANEGKLRDGLTHRLHKAPGDRRSEKRGRLARRPFGGSATTVRQSGNGLANRARLAERGRIPRTSWTLHAAKPQGGQKPRSGPQTTRRHDAPEKDPRWPRRPAPTGRTPGQPRHGGGRPQATKPLPPRGTATKAAAEGQHSTQGDHREAGRQDRAKATTARAKAASRPPRPPGRPAQDDEATK